MNEPNWNLAACRAACAAGEAETSWWFPERGQDNRRAKAICGECSLRAACLRWANESGEKWGIYGGQTERARRRDRLRVAA